MNGVHTTIQNPDKTQPSRIGMQKQHSFNMHCGHMKKHIVQALKCSMGYQLIHEIHITA